MSGNLRVFFFQGYDLTCWLWNDIRTELTSSYFHLLSIANPNIFNLPSNCGLNLVPRNSFSQKNLCSTEGSGTVINDMEKLQDNNNTGIIESNVTSSTQAVTDLPGSMSLYFAHALAGGRLLVNLEVAVDETDLASMKTEDEEAGEDDHNENNDIDGSNVISKRAPVPVQIQASSGASPLWVKDLTTNITGVFSRPLLRLTGQVATEQSPSMDPPENRNDSVQYGNRIVSVDVGDGARVDPKEARNDNINITEDHNDEMSIEVQPPNINKDHCISQRSVDDSVDDYVLRKILLASYRGIRLKLLQNEDMLQKKSIPLQPEAVTADVLAPSHPKRSREESTSLSTAAGSISETSSSSALLQSKGSKRIRTSIDALKPTVEGSDAIEGLVHEMESASNENVPPSTSADPTSEVDHCQLTTDALTDSLERLIRSRSIFVLKECKEDGSLYSIFPPYSSTDSDTPMPVRYDRTCWMSPASLFVHSSFLHVYVVTNPRTSKFTYSVDERCCPWILCNGNIHMKLFESLIARVLNTLTLYPGATADRVHAELPMLTKGQLLIFLRRLIELQLIREHTYYPIISTTNSDFFHSDLSSIRDNLIRESRSADKSKYSSSHMSNKYYFLNEKMWCNNHILADFN